MTTKTYKLDIFKTLSHISKKDTNFFTRLSEEEQNAFQPLVVMRWLSGTRLSRQIYFLNELVNPLVFAITKHPELLYNLMTICTTGVDRRHNWTKSLSKKTTSMPTAINIIKKQYRYNTLHAIDALKLLNNDDILELAEDHGLQKEDIAKLKRELKTRK